MVQKGSGNFEIVESGAAIVTGRIYVPEDINDEVTNIDPPTTSNDDSEDEPDLKTRDMYKELHLRGYNYKGLFRGISNVDVSGQSGRIVWNNNWVAFMDNMLQIQILQQDTRGLFVPTALDKVVINTKHHVQILNNLDPEVREIPVYAYKALQLVKCGGIEFRGLSVSAIAKRKPLGEAVLEKFMFRPYSIISDDPVSLTDAVRMCTHIILENEPAIKVRAIEYADGSSDPNLPALSPVILKALGDLPLIQAEISLYKQTNAPDYGELPSEIVIDDKKLAPDQSSLIVVASNVFDEARETSPANYLNALKHGGFFIAREKDNVTQTSFVKYPLVAKFKCEGEYLLLFRKHEVQQTEAKVVKVSQHDEEMPWLATLREAISSADVKKIYVVAEKEIDNGILGLFNCLRKESGGEKIRCVYIMDKNAPEFSLENPLFADQLAKDLALNVYKDGKWGSYRHLPLDDNEAKGVHHAFLNVTVRGDLSSFKWLQGDIDPLAERNPNSNDILAHVYYAALNFRDVMTSTGKLAPEVVSRGRLTQDCVQGLEFAGRLPNGRRVMGMVISKAMATLVEANKHFVWGVPDHWTLDEAATVPVCYGTAVYAMIMSGKIAKGDSVLIHAGSGGVGLAAIQLAFTYGCEVFTTVGTKEKRDFIKAAFPQLKDSNIGNSRDTSFEQMIMRETNGRGVDIVLNSLAEEKLLASVRCLAPGGRFLEIGKFDLASNNPLDMDQFAKDISFHGILLDHLLSVSTGLQVELYHLIEKGVQDGTIVPLKRKVFMADEVEAAFRYMAAGKHMGKILIKIRDEELPVQKVKPALYKQPAIPRFYASPKKSYIITGGLGGFGLELADWLVLRGCRKLVLTSRTGVKTGYQAYRIKIWKSYGVVVKVFTDDITTQGGVNSVLKKANILGPVGGIFNLSVVLRDALFENQTVENFQISFGPKAIATKYFDEISRKLCPQLKHFVVFSSVSCGRGNVGQTNYGMSNSVMERICELRHADGLPALAVQWGAVGDVGLVADMQELNEDIVIGGTLPQKITSCLQVLDSFLTQSQPVVASMVVAEKKSSGGAGNIVDAVLHIMGLKDLKSVSLHSTLAELGMDSMMAVEIKQTLEREFEVFLTPQDIRSMTFAKLFELANPDQATEGTKSDNKALEAVPLGFQYLLRVVQTEDVTSIPLRKLPSLESADSPMNPVFIIPGVEGVASIMEPLSKNLKAKALCFQFSIKNESHSIESCGEYIANLMIEQLTPGQRFTLVGYSFGGLVGLEVTRHLEAKGYVGHLIELDSSPSSMRNLTITALSPDDLSLQRNVLVTFTSLILPTAVDLVDKEIDSVDGWENKIELVLKHTEKNDTFSREYKILLMNAAYQRIKSALIYHGPPKKCIKSKVTLIRPSILLLGKEFDYDLDEYFIQPVSQRTVEGDHVTMLNNPVTADLINLICAEESS